MSSVLDTAVLGTDPWGLVNLEAIASEIPAEELAWVGEIPLEQKISATLSTLPVDAELFDLNLYARWNENRESLGSAGGELLDLSRSDEGFHLALIRDGTIEEIHVHRLIVTAPGGVDLVEDANPVPGTDSAVTGLLIDRFSLDWQAELREWRSSADQSLLALASGFRVDADGSTSEPGLMIGGLARCGFPETINPLSPAQSERESSTSTAEESRFNWEDVGMPEGFVETKTTHLRQLMKTILNNTDTDESERLLQELEGLAGVIDSYSRFRTEPALRRLRWKMLAGMNYIRPYLVSSEPSLA